MTREPREHSNQNNNNKGEWQSESTPIKKTIAQQHQMVLDLHEAKAITKGNTIRVK